MPKTMRSLPTILLSIILILANLATTAQTKSALFLGNSYTGANNLPQMVADVTASTGRLLEFDKNTPGGTTFNSHTSNATTLEKIAAEDWDYVILQGQSQEPSFPLSQVEEQTFPYAAELCDLIREDAPCSQPIFYMTWGRENGDQNNCAVWPPVCTYEGMDSLLNLRYRMMAEANDAFLSPVGAVWRYIRDNDLPVQLYSADGSHPSLAGTYAAACAFYTVIFRADPTEISFDDDLDAETAELIRDAAKVIVYDQLEEWQVGAFDAMADFTFTQNGNTFEFENLSTNADFHEWHFGNGAFAIDEHPVFTFPEGSELATINYVASSNCGSTDTLYWEVPLTATNIEFTHPEFSLLYPNPSNSLVKLPDANLVQKLEFVESGTGRSYEMLPQTWLDLKDLPAAIYMLQVFYKDGQTQTQKFLKQ